MDIFDLNFFYFFCQEKGAKNNPKGDFIFLKEDFLIFLLFIYGGKSNEKLWILGAVRVAWEPIK